MAEPARPVDVYLTLHQQAAAAEDTLLVYFAGHGRTGSRNELFLCLPDTDPDELPYSAWPYDELRRVLADSRATKKVVILDRCFSGRALADQTGDEETILGQVGIEGTYLLTATAANAVALAPPGERYTAFTGTLLGLLTAGIPDGPELLTFGEIYPRLHYNPYGPSASTAPPARERHHRPPRPDPQPGLHRTRPDPGLHRAIHCDHRPAQPRNDGTPAGRRARHGRPGR